MTTFALTRAQAYCPRPDRLGMEFVSDATVVIEDGRVQSVAPHGVVPSGVRVLDAEGRLVTPGLVDCHTHLLFLGDRSAEFCERAAGASYLQIAQRGGGIRATVRPTRGGTAEERRNRARIRLQRLVEQGVTTVEAKSGYGLSAEAEVAHLEDLRSLESPELPRVHRTLLAAHSVPPEVETPEQRAAWVQRIAQEIIPEVRRRGLAENVDVFVERSAYTPDEARQIAAAARASDLGLHLHVDQLTEGGGAALAVELGAKAAAHLERVSAPGIAALAASDTVAVLLPTATLAAGEPQYAPARALIDAGARIALSTNLNPGTAPTESTALMFFLAAVGLHLTPEEILWAATRGGALALGDEERGLLAPGCAADLVLWNARELSHLPYHAGVNHVRMVWRDGELICDRSEAADRLCDGLL